MASAEGVWEDRAARSSLGLWLRDVVGSFSPRHHSNSSCSTYRRITFRRVRALTVPSPGSWNGNRIQKHISSPSEEVRTSLDRDAVALAHGEVVAYVIVFSQ